MPLVSVLLPVRNAAPTLAHALDSLLAQTMCDFEIVVVDDHCQDGSPAILGSYASRDTRLRVVAAQGEGLVAALNQGLAQCQGKFVARMDADDVASPTRLQAQVALLQSDAGLGVASCLVDVAGTQQTPPGAGMIRYVDWLNGVRSADEIAAARFIESPVAHPTVMIRREVFLRHGGYRDGDFPEDYELWLRLLHEGVRFAKVPEVLLTWRDHPARTSRTDARYDRTAFRNLKIDFLLKGPLAARPTVIFVGAGLEGKPFLRAFAQHGVPVPYVVDIDPRKLGQRIHGASVVPPAQLQHVLDEHPEALVLTAIGVAEARGVIRTMLASTRLMEGQTSFFLC